MVPVTIASPNLALGQILAIIPCQLSLSHSRAIKSASSGSGRETLSMRSRIASSSILGCHGSVIASWAGGTWWPGVGLRRRGPWPGRRVPCRKARTVSECASLEYVLAMRRLHTGSLLTLRPVSFLCRFWRIWWAQRGPRSYEHETVGFAFVQSLHCSAIKFLNNTINRYIYEFVWILFENSMSERALQYSAILIFFSGWNQLSFTTWSSGAVQTPEAEKKKKRC